MNNKFHGFLLLMAFCCVHHVTAQQTAFASIKSPPQTVDDTDRRISLEAKLKEIETRYKVSFFYSNVLVKGKFLDSDLKYSSLDEALDKVLSRFQLTYKKMEGGLIVVSKANKINNNKDGALRPGGGTPVNTDIQASPVVRTGGIRGTVKGLNNVPLKGASVTIRGTQKLTVTDEKGQFSFNGITAGTHLLEVSYVGYAAVVQPVVVTDGANTAVTFQLSGKVSALNEVVMVGYGAQKKSDLTGAVATVKSSELQQSKAISFMEGLQGRVSGVQITSSSGEPGAAVNISIRGANSFNSGTQPLYVIDGVQIDVNTGEVATSSFGNTALLNPLASINPSDIASIEILKDASATAIFGSRGANGVIIVTTKSGKSNTSSLEVSSYVGVSRPSKKMKMLGAQDYTNYRFYANPQDTSFGRDTNNDGKLDAAKDMTGVPSHDWQDETLRSALSQNYNVSYTGGNAKSTYSASIGYLNQEGLIKNNNYERFNINLKLNHSASKRLKIGTSVNASQAIGKGAASNGGDGVRNWNGLIQNFLLYKPVNVPDPGSLNTDPDGGAFGSPVDFVNYSYKQTPFFRLIADLSVDYSIIDGLNLNIRGGSIITTSKNKEFYPTTTSWGLGSNGVAILNNSSTNNWYQTSTLTYSRRIKEDHLLTVLAGFELNSYIAESFGMIGQGFDVQSINAVDNIATAKVIAQVPTTNKYGYNRVSEFGRVNYSWKDRYLFTGTIRRDGSSKFGNSHKYALFPSAALAWRVSQEPFMEKQNIFTDLKIRGSFGVTGNDRIPPYQSLSTTANTFYSASTGNATLGISPNSLKNPALKWETTYQYDLGMEVSLLKERINFTADVYLKQTKDLLIQADIPGQTGYMKQWQNLGQVDNKGLELAVNTVNLKLGKFMWGSSFNISFNRNEVTSLGSVNYIPVTIYGSAISSVGRVILGQPIGTGYGYVFDGIYQVSDFDKQANGSYVLKQGVTRIQGRTSKPGDFKYKDLTGDGIVDNTHDYTIISNSNPKHFGGFTNNFYYKNFELNVLFQWSYGNDIINTGRYRYEAGAGYFANITQDYWDNKWTEDKPSNEYAALTGQGKVDISSYYVEDASYLRLKNVTLSYTLDDAFFIKKMGVKGCRFYVTGENLYTWTKYTGFDPEVASYSPLLPGIDNIAYPRSRTWTVGLNVKF